ncbi:hypothetical protein U1Q18_009979 [Sarracenia purpurea var. burkii]
MDYMQWWKAVMLVAVSVNLCKGLAVCLIWHHWLVQQWRPFSSIRCAVKKWAVTSSLPWMSTAVDLDFLLRLAALKLGLPCSQQPRSRKLPFLQFRSGLSMSNSATVCLICSFSFRSILHPGVAAMCLKLRFRFGVVHLLVGCALVMLSRPGVVFWHWIF